MRMPLQREGTGGDPARVAFRCHVKGGSGTLQAREQAMNPGVGLWLAQPELQAVHRLQRIRLLIGTDEKQLVFPLCHAAFGTPAGLPLASLALPGLVRWIKRCIGRSKRREQPRKLCVRQSGRGQKLSRSIF